MNKTGGIIVGVLALVVGGFVLVNTTDQTSDAGDATQIQVATSFYPLQFALEQIVGEAGEVINIGAGRDPHDFRPSTRDIANLKQADVVVLQGADFEPWGDDIQASLEVDGVPVLIATSDIELHEGGHDHTEDESKEGDHADEHHKEEIHDEATEYAHQDEHEGEHHDDHESTTQTDTHDDSHDHGAYDPHTWVDPVLMGETVEYLADELAALDPTNAQMYQDNAAALQAELTRLHTEYQDRLANCSLSEVITSHEAFGYVGDRYDFEIHTIAGLSTQDTPSVTKLAELEGKAAEGVGAILLEENSITAYGETLARETGLQTLSVNPIAYVIPAGADYFSLMRDNLTTFAVALDCNE